MLMPRVFERLEAATADQCEDFGRSSNRVHLIAVTNDEMVRVTAASHAIIA